MKDKIWEFFYWWKTVLLFKYNILQMLLLLSKQFTVLFITFSSLFSTKDMQTPPPLSVLIRFLWMMRCELNRLEKKNNAKILRFLFFELSWKIHRKLGWWRQKNDQKMTITRKIKIGINLKLGFSSYSADCSSFM